MRSFSKLSSVLSTSTMTAVLGLLALPRTALAGIELSNSYTSTNSKVIAIHNEYGKDVLVNTEFDVSDLKAMQTTLNDQACRIAKWISSNARSTI
ncbi:hypothetical protein [Pseudomonas sp. NFX224]|uniref:hypothetical protein n=1 Tax=Pseudomonas sp. NFX224 TaxID=3402862 RepID=UPI003AFA53DD